MNQLLLLEFEEQSSSVVQSGPGCSFLKRFEFQLYKGISGVELVSLLHSLKSQKTIPSIEFYVYSLVPSELKTFPNFFPAKYWSCMMIWGDLKNDFEICLNF